MTSENFVNIGPDNSLFWLVNSGVLWNSYEGNFTPRTKDQIVGWVSKLQSYISQGTMIMSSLIGPGINGLVVKLCISI